MVHCETGIIVTASLHGTIVGLEPNWGSICLGPPQRLSAGGPILLVHYQGAGHGSTGVAILLQCRDTTVPSIPTSSDLHWSLACVLQVRFRWEDGAGDPGGSRCPLPIHHNRPKVTN